MPLRFRYTITDRGREYLGTVDREAPSFDYRTWSEVAPEAAMFHALERTYPDPVTLRKVLLAVPEEERWPKEILVKAIHRLVSKGCIDYMGEVHED